jgi:alpha-D-ribose 1-methylphosphonate 5-triphosphate diphosphatase
VNFVLSNATIVLADDVISDGWLAVEGGLISAVGRGPVAQLYAELPQQPLHGAYLLPGLIDLHCDVIEKLVQPRPGVMVDPGVALHAADRLLLGSGITTEYHSLSLDDDEFGVRSEHFVSSFLTLLADDRHCGARHLVHARVELSSERGVPALQTMLDHPLLQLISMMDHSPGQGQYGDEASFRRYVAQTTGRSSDEIDAVIARKRRLKQQMPQRIDAVVSAAEEYCIPLASHDDDSIELVQSWAARGVSICEFPITLEAAQAARRAGMAVGMGAPNVLRGRSSGGNLSALEAIAAGAVDWLCADYYPAALLPAAFLLADRGLLSLAQSLALVTINPARAVGRDAFVGSIEAGKLADLIVVERATDPIVRQAFVGGKQVLSLNSRH